MITNNCPFVYSTMPTTGDRFITWNWNGQGERVLAYDLKQRKVRAFDEGVIDMVRTGGNVLAWRWKDPVEFENFVVQKSHKRPVPEVRYIIAE